MSSVTTRKIVRIDEQKCNGCGACVPACAEGALQIVDGKARLISEAYCDGLGACLGKCPMDAIIIEERPAQDFDEEAVSRHLSEARAGRASVGCASAVITTLGTRGASHRASSEPYRQPSLLGHWPVQLALVPPGAPFLRGTDAVLAAQCAAFAHADFHRDFLGERSLLIACPKLDDFPGHLARLTEILRKSGIKSLTVVRMEVPCCGGLTYMAREAIKLSGQKVPLRDVTIGIRGGVRAEA